MSSDRGDHPVGRARAVVALVVAGFVFTMSVSTVLAFDPLVGDFTRGEARDVRIVSYNHNRNFIDDASADAEFDRILTALDPDIICFQEFTEDVSPVDIADRLNGILPFGGAGWQIHCGLPTGIRTVIASRFPLTLTEIDTVPEAATRGVTLALADLPDADYAVDVYLLGVHLKCCGNPGGSEDASRQDSADAIANWMGDARGVTRPGGEHIELPADTPMIALGDFNLVGGPQPGDTLVTGDIQDTAAYGPDVQGDWDVSDLADLNPLDPFSGDDFTWQGNQNFPPGRLDRMFYTDSAATIANSFVLNTDTMTAAALSAAGLQSGDTLPQNTSDHLPIVLDLRLSAAGCADADEDGVCDSDDNCPDHANIEQVDCDTDGVGDTCAIAEGMSTDANANGVPDECEAACPRGVAADCADTDGDRRRDDACTWWTCNAGICESTAVVYSDVGSANGGCPPDGTVDGNDRFHALNCFADTDTFGMAGYDCEDNSPQALNVDAGGEFGSCQPDGVCDGHDAFHALNKFEGTSTCSCPLDGGPAPGGEWRRGVPPRSLQVEGAAVKDTAVDAAGSAKSKGRAKVGGKVNPASRTDGVGRNRPGRQGLGRAGLRLVASSRVIAGGEFVEVDAYLDGKLAELRGYQLHLGITGGKAGRLELVDMFLDETRADRVILLPGWQAFNITTGQMLVGLDTHGGAVGAGYLGTFRVRASKDAEGTFAVDLLHDPAQPNERTFLFPGEPNGRIFITNVESTSITLNNE